MQGLIQYILLDSNRYATYDPVLACLHSANIHWVSAVPAMANRCKNAGKLPPLSQHWHADWELTTMIPSIFSIKKTRQSGNLTSTRDAVMFVSTCYMCLRLC